MSIQGFIVFVCLATVDYCVEAEDVIVLCATMRFTYTCIFTYYKTVEQQQQQQRPFNGL